MRRARRAAGARRRPAAGRPSRWSVDSAGSRRWLSPPPSPGMWWCRVQRRLSPSHQLRRQFGAAVPAKSSCRLRRKKRQPAPGESGAIAIFVKLAELAPRPSASCGNHAPSPSKLRYGGAIFPVVESATALSLTASIRRVKKVTSGLLCSDRPRSPDVSNTPVAQDS